MAESELSAEVVRTELAREVEHWRLAATRLADIDQLAPPESWSALEHYLGVALRQTLAKASERVRAAAERLTADAARAATLESLTAVRARVLDLRRSYFRAETTLEFFADAIATRAVPHAAAMLRASDHIANRAMAEALTPLGRQVPAALTYYRRGAGASVLKAGLRLWDGWEDNPVAAIKVTRHAGGVGASLVHECGHEVAHMTDWNGQLADALGRTLRNASTELADLIAAFASEIAADAYAFVHTGYASLAGLHDVVDGEDSAVFALLPGDPHPPGYLRVLLWCMACRRAYGDGPWDALGAVWKQHHPISRAPSDVRGFFERSERELPRIVECVLYAPYAAFGGRSLTQLINPQRVSPAALAQLEREAGNAALTSPFWIWGEAVRLVALNGYRAGLDRDGANQSAAQQEQLMLRLGDLRSAA